MATRKPRKAAAPEPEMVVVEPEPTFTVPSVPEPVQLTPIQIEAELVVSAAQATSNELRRENANKADAVVLAIRVIQSAKRLVELLRA